MSFPDFLFCQIIVKSEIEGEVRSLKLWEVFILQIFFLYLLYISHCGVCPLLQEKILHAYLWFRENDDFVIHLFSKCYSMHDMSQVLSLKLHLYCWSGLWRMHVISVGRDGRMGRDFEGNKINRTKVGINVGNKVA